MRIASSKRTEPTTSAEDRARRAWADMAHEVCCDVRMMGLVGYLPRPLTDMAHEGRSHRGGAIPSGLHKTAKAMKEAGLPREDAEQRLTDRVRFIVQLTYADSPGAA